MKSLFHQCNKNQGIYKAYCLFQSFLPIKEITTSSTPVAIRMIWSIDKQYVISVSRLHTKSFNSGYSIRKKILIGMAQTPHKINSQRLSLLWQNGNTATVTNSESTVATTPQIDLKYKDPNAIRNGIKTNTPLILILFIFFSPLSNMSNYYCYNTYQIHY